uniref:lipid asymmetry maintenance protein MlaB n=1 Tax=Pantoea sp. IMH TaxID=1267600 RepID=UPI0004696563|nr:lipid asymmetry maintenance protein MlaB [Pantoea sp. IMH]
MSDHLSWQSEGNQLRLAGVLERETLLALWEARYGVMKQIDTIDVSALSRVDSAGLALLVHLQQIAQQQGNTLKFSGITDKLHSLISLYNLQQIILAGN